MERLLQDDNSSESGVLSCWAEEKRRGIWGQRAWVLVPTIRNLTGTIRRVFSALRVGLSAVLFTGSCYDITDTTLLVKRPCIAERHPRLSVTKSHE